MNPEKAMVHVQTAILTHPPAISKWWVICWLDHRFQCLPRSAVKDDGNVFLIFTDDDFREGFTIKQWDECKRNVAKFFDRKDKDT